MVTLLIVGGCSSPAKHYPNDDYGPREPVDVSQVPDAVPQDVPYSKYGNPSSYKVRGKTYHVLRTGKGYRGTGEASWYGLKFHGKRTSSGEAYDMYAMTAAHKTLPLPTWVRVTNLENGRSVVVKVNDRGPFHSGRIIDLSYAAASRIGMLGKGTAPVEVVALQPQQKAAEAPLVKSGVAGTGDHFPLWIQTGAFTREDNARQQLRRLQQHSGLAGSIHPLVQSETILYRVWLGPVENDRVLQELRLKLPEWGIPAYRVVQ